MLNALICSRERRYSIRKSLPGSLSYTHPYKGKGLLRGISRKPPEDVTEAKAIHIYLLQWKFLFSMPVAPSKIHCANHVSYLLFFEFRSELALGVLGSRMSIRSFPRLYSWVNSPQYDKKVGQETKHTLTVRSQHADKICGVESLRTTL